MPHSVHVRIDRVDARCTSASSCCRSLVRSRFFAFIGSRKENLKTLALGERRGRATVRRVSATGTRELAVTKRHGQDASTGALIRHLVFGPAVASTGRSTKRHGVLPAA